MGTTTDGTSPAKLSTSAWARVDLPAPGGPATPTRTRALTLSSGAITARASASSCGAMASMLACRYGLIVTTARRAACLLVLLMLLVSCSDDRGDRTSPGGTVRIVASAALADAFATLAHDFETR